MKKMLGIWFYFLSLSVSFSQTIVTCDTEKLNDLYWSTNPKANANHQHLEAFIESFQATNQSSSYRSISALSKITEYTIPVVIHVFYIGEIGKIDEEQALSGLQIINRDFQALNDDWNTVDPLFEDIKSSLNIKFVLASNDPNGNHTSGIVYHEDSISTYKNIDHELYAWDNRHYLNIYLPKYVLGDSSLQSGFTRFPSINHIDKNRGGVFMSSGRWGFGSQSDFKEGDEWASIATHEVGHWLGLFHTFRNGCEGVGDAVEDTPPTMDSGIQLEGCRNNNLSCNVITNGENYMDYNHRCKKMFTQGQVDRMVAVLHSEPRKNLWSRANLERTGCDNFEDTRLLIYPNPTQDWVIFDTKHVPVNLKVYNSSGLLVYQQEVKKPIHRWSIKHLSKGLYFSSYEMDGKLFQGRFLVE